MSKQESRNKAFKLVTDLMKRSRDAEYSEACGFSIDAERQANLAMNMAEAELLTFIDTLIRGFGYSRATQACVTACNKRKFESLGKGKIK